MNVPDTQPREDFCRRKKLKNNFTGKKRLIFVSKSLFDLKASEGISRKILGDHLGFVMNAFYVCPLILSRSILGGTRHSFRIKTFDNVATSS
jgi:hypothetical protein